MGKKLHFTFQKVVVSKNSTSQHAGWSLSRFLPYVDTSRGFPCGKRRKGWQRMRWVDSITDSVDMNWSSLQKIVEDRGAWRAAVHGIAEPDTT